MRFEPTSEMRGDCTISYDVKTDKPMKVGEFIEEVLTEKADEWGKFYFIEKPDAIHWENPFCEYRCGNRLGNDWDKMMRKFGNRTIKMIKGDGGWTCMDYMIYFV